MGRDFQAAEGGKDHSIIDEKCDVVLSERRLCGSTPVIIFVKQDPVGLDEDEIAHSSRSEYRRRNAANNSQASKRVQHSRGETQY
jgi:hypothetical protein